MCFQIVDDVLDVTRTEAELGKPAGNDLLEGVYTLPVIYAVARVDELARPARARARPRAARPCARARRRRTTRSTASMAVARTHATKATEALAGTDDLDPHVCDRLADLVEGLVLREF